MATLPVMGYVVGGALSTGLVARSQTRWGRQVSFQIGLLVAVLSCAVAGLGHCEQRLLAVGGRHGGGRLLQRQRPVVPFCRRRTGPARGAREKAVSLVLAGGLIGAIAGPNLAARTRGLLEVPFAGAYIVLAGVAVVAMGLMALVRFPAHAPHLPMPAQGSAGRPMGAIMRQPEFLVAIAGALGYGVMNLLMAATPLAMQQCGLGFDDAALVLQWHVIGMFAPGFFTGS
jgi:hypothetical protein